MRFKTHFFEFLPIAEEHSSQPIVLEAHELEEGRDYFILLTTSSGLYRYNIRDVVRCTGHHGATPLLEFRHKGSHISEHHRRENHRIPIVESVNAATVGTALRPELFTMTPIWGDPPGYVLYISLNQSGPTASAEFLKRLSASVDMELKRRNVEYAEKRGQGRLAPLRVEVLANAGWTQFAKSRQSKAGGSLEQYKHPCLVPTHSFSECFSTLVSRQVTQDRLLTSVEFSQLQF